MKSRVNKYADLHQKIASDSESTVENSDLSHFSNRLSEIDDQFERVHTSKQDIISPSRARKNKTEVKETQDPMVDTFETHYLKDFLDEVKEYNVQKGYRDISDTQANILDELKMELSDESKEITNVQEEDLDETQTIYSEKELAKIARELIEEEDKLDAKATSQEKSEPIEKEQEVIEDNNDFEDTLVFGQEISIQPQEDEDSKEDTDSEESIQPEESSNEQTISMAIQEMSFDDNDEDDSEVTSEEDSKESDSDQEKEQNLFEQTQTLQHKVLDLESNLDEMSTTTSKTNRLLHVVLSLLLFAIIVVALLIAAQLL